jgi:hypothetical protein
VERVDLVLHECDQRGDDDTGAGSDQSRDLVAERLAATGRHEHERVAALDHALDDRRLLTPERLVAEDAMEDLERGGSGGDHAVNSTGRG